MFREDKPNNQREQGQHSLKYLEKCHVLLCFSGTAEVDRIRGICR